jgi:hypothetical protein
MDRGTDINELEVNTPLCGLTAGRLVATQRSFSLPIDFQQPGAQKCKNERVNNIATDKTAYMIPTGVYMQRMFCIFDMQLRLPFAASKLAQNRLRCTYTPGCYDQVLKKTKTVCEIQRADHPK